MWRVYWLKRVYALIFVCSLKKCRICSARLVPFVGSPGQRQLAAIGFGLRVVDALRGLFSITPGRAALKALTDCLGGTAELDHLQQTLGRADVDPPMLARMALYRARL